jgi:mannose-6-phosphate isomerase class I
MSRIPFSHIDWTSIEKVEFKGVKGISYCQTIQYPMLRIRLVEYSIDYLADHWCQKGHIVHCLSGEFITELRTGEKINLVKGDSFVVTNDASSHRSVSINGAKLLIIDGDFLK